MLIFKRPMELPRHKCTELAAVMACDGDESRYDEFLSWLEKDFSSLDHSRRAYIVAESGGVIVGFIRLWHSPHVDKWFNDGMVVSPAFRRQGIGRGLLQQALQAAARMGASSVIAQIGKDNIASIRFHEKAGFLPETMEYLNSYGQPRSGVGRQYRIQLHERTGGELLVRLTEFVTNCRAADPDGEYPHV